MKTKPLPFLPLLFIALSAVPVNYLAVAQDQTKAEPGKEAKASQGKTEDAASSASSEQNPLPADPEERFKFLFTKSYLSGRWAPLKNGALGDEKSGDKYHIVSAIKGNGDHWTVNASMKYGDREIVIPIPVQMKFVGDVAILEVNNLAIPGGGTYMARLLIHERTYSGSWKGQRGGGMLYGTITNEAE